MSAAVATACCILMLASTVSGIRFEGRAAESFSERPLEGTSNMSATQQHNTAQNGAQALQQHSAELGAACTAEVVHVLGSAGGLFCISSQPPWRPAAKSVKHGKIWEPITHKLFARFLAKTNKSVGDVVDAGLFFGDYLPHLSRLVGSHGRVWGFEPNPSSFQLARGTVHANQLTNAWIFNAGLGEANGTAEFCVAKHGRPLGGQTHMLMRSSQKNTGCSWASVPIVALDEVLPPERRINVIHLDVENQELNVLHGAVKTIRRWRPLVVVEGRVPAVTHFMKELKYKADDNMQSYVAEGNLAYVPLDAGL
eukprot:gnl/TRDRNA2_/TRDRNA2_185010_c0_seq1.p1 gnl/TRDRNA2_/TRDRNA2_185010_c0~~gnl/TRDRNA2_/TRDRNA2_185010_c0_seq1.p1  ORF type:complete len:352 (+),score=40.19 gnl/TRDRNA2_/TRDRNA2_185010_c0_seq1:129-1058(+)